MKILIIGTPGSGKTTLANMIRKDLDNSITISLCSIRSLLGFHEPHKGYETEVNPKRIPALLKIINIAIDDASKEHNVIIEGYGISPIDALKLHVDNIILLGRNDTTALENYERARKYDDKNKWTQRRSDKYLIELEKFYKTVENKWMNEDIKGINKFDTTDFEIGIKKAFEYYKSLK